MDQLDQTIEEILQIDGILPERKVDQGWYDPHQGSVAIQPDANDKPYNHHNYCMILCGTKRYLTPYQSRTTIQDTRGRHWPYPGLPTCATTGRELHNYTNIAELPIHPHFKCKAFRVREEQMMEGTTRHETKDENVVVAQRFWVHFGSAILGPFHVSEQIREGKS